MGVDLSVWRARIGSHCVSVSRVCSLKKINLLNAYKFEFYHGLITAILLIAAGIESNPGPTNDPGVCAYLNEKFATLRCEFKKDMAALRYQFAAHEIKNKNQIDNLQQKIESLAHDNKNLKNKVASLERQQRKNNVIMFGIPDPLNSECCNDTVKNICDKMDMKLPEGAIIDSFRLGKAKGNRPILCKFSTFSHKQELMQKSKSCENITVLHDLTKQDRIDRKKLKPKLDNARSRGFRAVIRDGKLIIDGTAFSKEDAATIQSGTTGNPAQNQPLTPRSRAPPQQVSVSSCSEDDELENATPQTSPSAAPVKTAASLSPRPSRKKKQTTNPLPAVPPSPDALMDAARMMQESPSRPLSPSLSITVPPPTAEKRSNNMRRCRVLALPRSKQKLIDFIPKNAKKLCQLKNISTSSPVKSFENMSKNLKFVNDETIKSVYKFGHTCVTRSRRKNFESRKRLNCGHLNILSD